MPNIRVSTASSPTASRNQVLSLYIGIAASGKNVCPVWCDTRSGNVDAYFAAGTLP